MTDAGAALLSCPRFVSRAGPMGCVNTSGGDGRGAPDARRRLDGARPARNGRAP